MAEELKQRQLKGKRVSRIAGICLVAAMATMALWGWTPLKTMIPGFYTLVIFLAFLVCSMGATVYTLYLDMKISAAKARIADQ